MLLSKIRRRSRRVKQPPSEGVCTFCGRASEIARRPFGLRVCVSCADESRAALVAACALAGKLEFDSRGHTFEPASIAIANGGAR